jgi:ribosomal protein L2
MENIIKGVVIIEGLLVADIEEEVTNVCINKLIFNENKIKIFCKITTIEYDPNCNANICFTQYEDGEKQYILHPRGIKIRGIVIFNIDVPILVGNTVPLSVV